MNGSSSFLDWISKHGWPDPQISSLISYHHLPPPLCCSHTGWNGYSRLADSIHSHSVYVSSCATHAGNLKHFLTPLKLGLQQLDAFVGRWKEGRDQIVLAIFAVRLWRHQHMYGLLIQGLDMSWSWQWCRQWLSDLSLGGSFSNVPSISTFPAMTWLLSDYERGSKVSSMVCQGSFLISSLGLITFFKYLESFCF